MSLCLVSDIAKMLAEMDDISLTDVILAMEQTFPTSKLFVLLAELFHQGWDIEDFDKALRCGRAGGPVRPPRPRQTSAEVLGRPNPGGYPIALKAN